MIAGVKPSIVKSIFTFTIFFNKFIKKNILAIQKKKKKKKFMLPSKISPGSFAKWVNNIVEGKK